jgi:hypothetical protein
MTDRHRQRPYKKPGLWFAVFFRQMEAPGPFKSEPVDRRSISKLSGRCPDKTCFRHERSGHGAAQAHRVEVRVNPQQEALIR